MRILSSILIVLLTSFALAQNAAEDARVQALGKQIRCPICQGLSITESSTDFSRSMLNELKDRVKQGQTDETIRDYFVSKYGRVVLLEPPKSGTDLIVWGAPLVILFGGAIGLFSYLRRASTQAMPEVHGASLEKVRQQLEELDESKRA
jgi:cytochrome c-type biogenesis protein CcmH